MHAGGDARARRSLLRQLGCKAQEVTTTLLKHLAKEEEQLFPLLLQHFTYAEQARAPPCLVFGSHPRL